MASCFSEREGFMEKRESQKDTAAPEAAGKTIKVRQATAADMAFIKAHLEKNNMDAGDLAPDEFVVATQDGTIAGFGRMRKTGTFYQIGCVVVVEEKRSRGIGALIIQHLLDSAQVDLVYVLTDLVDYFTKRGFVEMKEGSKELFDALDEECKVKGKPNTTIMMYEKSKP